LHIAPAQYVCLSYSSHRLDLHAFPTRRSSDLVLQGRYDDYPRRRGHTRIDQLREAGVTVGVGHDSVMDPWYHYGRADPLDSAHLDRKSTRLNSSHVSISYAVFCLKTKTTQDES